MQSKWAGLGVLSSVAVLAAAACTGSISDKGAGAGSGGGGGGSTQTGALCTASSPRDPGPSSIRRATRLEYDNTVRDLLGATAPAATGFPTEERRLGFDNNADALSVSPLLAEQYLLTAEKLATDAVNNRFATLVPCDPAAAGADACGQQFIAAFGKKAYRRPLTADDTATLTAVFDAGKATDFKTGVRLVIETVLQSPQFLYRIEQGLPPQGSDPTVKVTDAAGATSNVKVVRLDGWEMASRLSYLLWHSMPDEALFAAAEAGELTTAAGIAAQADRMLRDPRARAMVSDFHGQWLRVAEIDGVEKDAAVFPAFGAATAGLMRQETEAFLDHVVWESAGTLDELFGAPYTFVNGALASYYGIAGVSGTAFVRVDLDPGQRAGLLTQGGLLSLLSKANQTSPVHRGKFVREQLLCDELPPPPPDIEIKPPDLSPTLTTRERFSQHAQSASCSVCHHLMDPIGLGFEHFDGAGRFRATENDRPIDATGAVDDADPAVAGGFDGVLELGRKLAGSADVQACVAKKWFRYAYGRGETPADACSLARVSDRFASGGGKFTDLLLALTQSDAFLYRRVTPASGGGQ